MTGPRFQEASAVARTRSVPLAHASIELGHLYFEDFGGIDRLEAYFRRVAPWAESARGIVGTGLRGTPRISTCFLVDDYFGPSGSPAVILPDLLQAAKAAGVEIDYLARESACATAGDVPLARMVEDRIVADPPPDTTGTRPPVTESGWLSNGQRSPTDRAGEAMEAVTAWAPPAENATNRHSVFVDVELWDERPQRGRVWSCAYLASVWQLLRLGLIRYRGEPVATPDTWDGPFPESWDRLPAVTRLNPAAAPFSAYRTVSIMGTRFLPTELAVRTILNQVAVDPAVNEDVVRRAGAEGMDLPTAPVDRLAYLFVV